MGFDIFFDHASIVPLKLTQKMASIEQLLEETKVSDIFVPQVKIFICYVEYSRSIPFILIPLCAERSRRYSF